MSKGHGGRRAGAGRKPDAAVQKLRAELGGSIPEAMEIVRGVLSNPDDPNHYACARWVLDKAIPSLKPETMHVKFNLSGDTAADQARSIVEAASNGILSATVATELLTAIAACAKVIEVSEFEDAIAEIKAKQEKQK